LAGQRDIAHEKLFVFSLALIRFCKWLGIVEESRVKSWLDDLSMAVQS